MVQLKKAEVNKVEISAKLSVQKKKKKASFQCDIFSETEAFLGMQGAKEICHRATI